MKFVATKTADQLDLQTLHRVRERFVSQRKDIIKRIRTLLLAWTSLQVSFYLKAALSLRKAK